MAISPSQNTDQISREMAMSNKIMFVVYVLLLASLGFALDLSIAAMIILPS